MSYIPYDDIQIAGEVDIKEEKHEFDAFGRLRTSQVTTLFESQLSNSEQNKFWHTIKEGSASTTYLSNQSSLELSVTATVGDKAIRQSKVYTRARLGKSHIVFLTGNFNGGVSGVKKRIGYFDEENGVFFQMNGETLEVVVRSKASGTVQETAIPQSTWNIDKFDGTGESGISINTSFDQVFVFDIEWLGTGKVRAGILIDGKLTYVHEFKFTNTQNTPYMTTATLPSRYDIETDGTNAATLKQTAVVIMTEGGSNEFPSCFDISNEITPKQVMNTLTPILSIKPKTIFKNKVNRISTLLEEAEIYSTDDDIYYEIRKDCILSAPFWNGVDDEESSVEYDYSSNGFSGGEVVMKGYVKGNGILNKIEKEKSVRHILTTNYEGTDSSNLTLLAKTINTTSSDVFATFRWKEDD